jgi:hypothetical protein
LPAPYRPFNPVIQGQLSGDDFSNSSTRQEPSTVTHEWLQPGKKIEHYFHFLSLKI